MNVITKSQQLVLVFKPFLDHRWKIVIMYTACTDLFINNGTLDFANKIKTIDHIGLILSRIHIHPMPQVSCKFGNDIRRNKATVMILVKEAKIV